MEVKSENCLSKIEEEEAIESMNNEWRTFDVPQVISDRINELWWDGHDEKVTIDILVKEFEAERCYMDKCYFFSEPNKPRREEIESDGGFYDCQFCKESCIPKSVRNFVA